MQIAKLIFAFTFLAKTLPVASEASGTNPTCIDNPPGWHDIDGPYYDCDWYAQGSRCLSYGDSYENFGLTANQACCACGGGNDGRNGESWVGSYTGEAMYGGNNGEWGNAGTFPLRIDDDGTVYISGKEIEGSTFDTAENKLSWTLADGNDSEGSISFHDTKTSSYHFPDFEDSSVLQSFTGAIRFSAAGGFLDYRGILGITEWIGAYTGEAMYGGNNGEWGNAGTFPLRIDNDGTVYISGKEIEGSTFDTAENKLSWTLADGNDSEGSISFHDTKTSSYHFPDFEDSSALQSFTGAIRFSAAGGFLDYRGILGITEWIGAYTGEAMYGGNNYGEWGNAGTFPLRIDDDGTVYISGKEIEGSIFDTTENKLSWALADGNDSEGSISFYAVGTSSYYFSDFEGFSVGQSFTGWIRPDGPGGAFDFRGILGEA